MKKNFMYLCALLMGVLCFCSCSSDDDDAPKVASSLLRVSNATYQEGSFPAATSAAELTNVSISAVESNGATTLRVPDDKDFVRYFIGIKNVPGYYVFSPWGTRASDDDEEYFDISLMLTNTKSSTTLMVSAETTDGSVTKPYEQTINYSTSGEGKGRLKSVVMKDDYGQTYERCEFSYDASGRVTKFIYKEYHDDTPSVTDYEMHTTFTWPSSLINSEFEMKSSSYARVYDDQDNAKNLELEYSDKSVYKTNNKGYVTNGTVTDVDGVADGEHETSYVRIDYDSDGHILSSYDDSDGMLFKCTWSNGNMVRYESEEDNDDTSATLFTYTDIPNPNLPVSIFLPDIEDESGIFFNMGLWGQPNKNLPSKISFSDGGGTLEFSYTMNSDGTINKVKVKEAGGYDDETVTLYFHY